MKKLFALVLAVAMICAMSVNVFAANVIGTHGQNKGTNGVDDGVTTFDDKDTDTTVTITANSGSIDHRYAVDIVYDTMTFNVTGSSLVWNVNELVYEVKDGGALVGNQLFNVTVTNYSDLDVYLTVNVVDTNGSDSATVDAYVDADATANAGDALSHDKITIDSAVAGTEIEFAFDIKVTANDWNAVSQYYAQYFTNNPGTTTATMGTVTLTLSKDAPAAP